MTPFLTKQDADGPTIGKLNHRIYNVSTEETVTFGRIVEAIQKVVPDFKPALQPGNGPRHRPNAYLDTARLTEDTGYAPKYNVDAALAGYVVWLQLHPDEANLSKPG